MRIRIRIRHTAHVRSHRGTRIHRTTAAQTHAGTHQEWPQQRPLRGPAQTCPRQRDPQMKTGLRRQAGPSRAGADSSCARARVHEGEQVEKMGKPRGRGKGRGKGEGKRRGRKGRQRRGHRGSQRGGGEPKEKSRNIGESQRGSQGEVGESQRGRQGEVGESWGGDEGGHEGTSQVRGGHVRAGAGMLGQVRACEGSVGMRRQSGRGRAVRAREGAHARATQSAGTSRSDRPAP
jgi:hypothetical protein